MSDHDSASIYDIPLDGDLDDLGIYIDPVLPSLELAVQIAAIERYLKRTGSATVSFVREGDTDCLLMCPDNLVQTPSVQWRIADGLATARERIDALRDHFNASGMQNQSIKYVSTACKVCGNTEGLKWCGACNKVRYCGATCQRADWKEHKKFCVRKKE
jgi:hypothetical protein